MTYDSVHKEKHIVPLRCRPLSISACLAPVLLAAPFLLASCAPASTTFRYGGKFAEGARSLPSPRVGTAVVVFGPSGGGRDIDTLREKLVDALPSLLREKGYESALLHSLAFSGSFNMSSFDGTRPHRSQLQEPVFAAAQSKGLSGVFVLWVNAKRSRPSEQVGYSRATGTEEVLSLSARLEIYSPAGEPLCVQDAFVWGMDSVKITGESKIAGTYHVLSGAELADQLTRKALALLPVRSSGGATRAR